MNSPEFPIYVISKGRWNSRLTSKALERMKVHYHIVVEEQEYARYADVIDRKKILVLDKSYLQDYDMLDDLSDLKTKGPGPARNFVWDHSISNGYKWHWVLDDNIDGFMRLNRNKKIKARSGAIFRQMEDLVGQFTNVVIAGPHYDFFAKQNQKLPPFYFNRRIYSCLLIRNDIPYRWRGRYNDDTDLCLRVLKDGWCTILFLAFLACKARTMAMKGGNTDELYAGDGRLEMARSLVRQHPDVAKVSWKFGRWQHHVDYRPFKKNRPRFDACSKDK